MQISERKCKATLYIARGDDQHFMQHIKATLYRCGWFLMVDINSYHELHLHSFGGVEVTLTREDKIPCSEVTRPIAVGSHVLLQLGLRVNSYSPLYTIHCMAGLYQRLD